MSEEYDDQFKICIVGDNGIGKEDFISSFIGRDFPDQSYKLTVGVDLFKKDITIDTQESGPLRINLSVWDITGEKRFRDIITKFFKGATGFILFFDLTNHESFLHLSDYIKLISERKIRKRKREKGNLKWEYHPATKVPLLLIGNKTDPERFAISPKEFVDFIRKHNLYYMEISGIKKEEAFDSFYCITSLMVGVDIHSEYLLSEKVIPPPIPLPPSSSTSKLTPQDLRSLSQKAIFQKLQALEKKMDDFKAQDETISKQLELKEKELKLRERELKFKESKLTKETNIDDLLIKENISVFLSYASQDSELFKIKEIAENLKEWKGITEVLFYEGGSYDNFVKYMNDNIGKCDVMLLFCSPNALKSKSVEKEWTAADAIGKPLIPVFIKTEHIPPLLKSRIYVEFDTFDIQKTIKEIYNLILKKVRQRLIDLEDLKTDF